MRFKIDTTASYTRILPAGEPLSATMAAELYAQCQERSVSGSPHYIVDFSELPDAALEEPTAVFDTLTGLHEALYSADRSLVFTGIGPQVLAQFKGADLHHILNLTPTLPEAIDMVNMEILERDLFNNEDEP